MKQDQHNHTNRTTLDGLSDVSGKLKYNGQDVGVGDMEKSVYDVDGDGKVDVANNSEKLGGQLPSYYAKQSDVDNKVDKVAGKQLSTNDYTTTEKTKLAEIKTATQSEAIAGTSNAVYMTPLRVKDYVLENTIESNTLTAWLDSKVDKVTGKGLSANDFTDEHKIKVDEIPNNPKYTDTVYTHPSNHPASMITESTTKRFVSDTEKATWNGKADVSAIPTKTSQLSNDSSYVTQEELGEAGFGDMLKSVYDSNGNGIVDNAEKVNGFTIGVSVPSNAKFTDTVYSHPSSHPASIITESTTKRFVSDAEKSAWNAKETPAGATAKASTAEQNAKDYADAGLADKVDKVTGKGLSTNDYTTTEKNKLNGIQAGAEVNTVTSVAGKTGAVTVSKSDIGLGNVDNLSAASIRSGTTKANVGLGNVDNIKQMPISGGVLESYGEKLVTTSGGHINTSLGNVFQHTPISNITYSMGNPANGQAYSFTLIINMGSTVRTLTFPMRVKWQGGEIPDMSTANKTYVLTFVTVDGGSNWLGMFGGEF